MATQPTVAGEILNIPLVDIIPSKTNPRGKPTAEGLDDLAADISRRGVQQAIVVRPCKGKNPYEIVFGERRFLASRKAKQETIPCVVRKLSDEQAYEAQVIENLQREDLHPLDEAAAFKRMYDQIYKGTQHHDQTIAQVAEKIGKKRKPEFIAQRLKFNELDPKAKQAFRDGELLLGHATELARLRPEEQKIVLAWMLQQEKDIQTLEGRKSARVVPGVPELRLWIQQNLFLDLAKAPFDITDPRLNPSMGACIVCPFKTGNQPALFGDVQQGDTCTVPTCWSQKRDQHFVQITEAKAKALGVKKVFKVGLGYASWNRAKIPVDVYVEHSSGVRLVKLGDECTNTKPGIVTWIGHPSDAAGRKPGDAVLVCPKTAECEKHKHSDSRAERKPKSFEQMADTRIDNLRRELPQRVRAALIAAVVKRAKSQEKSSTGKNGIKFELMAQQMHSDLFFDRHRDLCKLLDIQPELDRHKSKDWRGTSRKIFTGNPVALMVAMTLMHCFHVGTYGRHDDPLPILLRLYRVNAKAIEKQVKAGIFDKVAAIQQALKKRKAKTQRPKKHESTIK